MKRNENGEVQLNIIQKIKCWNLGRKLRKGKVPRGRQVTMKNAQDAMGFTQRGELTEVWGMLGIKVIRANGTVEDKGLVSVRKITTAFRDYIVDALQDSASFPMDAFSWHASGTGVTAEANTQTELVTEVASRTDGTQVEGASANIYRSVGTIAYSSSFSITEHGLFSANTTGTMLDRSVFGTITVDNGDSIQFTYEATFNAEA
jgi:hypothetical protein